jgi:hypothetical protein
MTPEPSGRSIQPSHRVALAPLLATALLAAVLDDCGPGPVAVVVDKTKHCRLCGRTVRVDTVNMRTVVKLSKVREAVADIGLRSYGPAKNLLSSSYLQHDLFKALQRGDRRYSVVTYEDTCDSCLDAPVPMRVGFDRRCAYCSKELGQVVTTRSVKRRVFHGDSVTVKTGFCGSRACRLKRDHPTWSISDCRTIAERKIRIGLTAEQAVAAWGRPDHINRTATAYGLHEQWVYEHGDYSTLYLYFDDGVLTSWQD